LDSSADCRRPETLTPQRKRATAEQRELVSAKGARSLARENGVVPYKGQARHPLSLIGDCVQGMEAGDGRDPATGLDAQHESPTRQRRGAPGCRLPQVKNSIDGLLQDVP
jgi:hypothetical protein